GARVLARTWRETFGNKQATVLLGLLQDKDAAAICAALGPIAYRWFLPEIQSERALKPEELRIIIQDRLPSASLAVFPSFGPALAEALEDTAPILITGSLHFAGEALAALRGEPTAFEECLQ